MTGDGRSPRSSAGTPAGTPPASGAADWPTADPIADRARTTPDRTALVDAGADEDAERDEDTVRELTYRQYDDRVTNLAAGLAATDADRVGLLLEPGVPFAAVLFAAMRTGTTVVPLSLRETIPELDRTCERADVDAIVCDPEHAARAVDLDVDRLLGVGGFADDASIRALDDLGSSSASSAPTGTDHGAFDRERTQLVLFTSGTTGEPKGVRLSVETLRESAIASAFRLGVSPGDRWLCCLPTYHMGGLAPILRSALYGTTTIIQRGFEADETARLVDDEGVTGISLVPTMLDRLLEADWSPPETLRFVLLGGAPASPDLIERSLAAGVPVHPTYGLTETASQVATATPAQVESHPGTVGQPLAPTRVTVVDRSGDPLPAGERGELVVDGPTVTSGYLDPAHTEDAFGDYGLHTGDVGYRDEDGRLWVTDRLTDRIVTGGENVDPAEVVETLRAHPDIEAAAVVGIPDDEWGERVGALLVPADGRSPPSTESIRDHCEGRLAGFKRPRTIAVVDELPRTASGTLDRQAARNQLLRDGHSC